MRKLSENLKVGPKMWEQKWIALTNKCIYHLISNCDQLLGPLQGPIEACAKNLNEHQDNLR